MSIRCLEPNLHLKMFAQSAGHCFNHQRRLMETAESIAKLGGRIDHKAQHDIKELGWIDKLLKEKEGGGYILEHAGIVAQPIAWGDLDSFGHVNNVRYLKWFEEARVNRFALLSASMPGQGFETFMDPIGVGPIMRAADISWRRPISFPDSVTVIHKLLPDVKEDRFQLQGVLISHLRREVAARITETIVTVDYTNSGVKAPIPSNISKAFESLLLEQATRMD